MVRGEHNGRIPAASHNGAEERSMLQIARKVAATLGADFFQAIAKHLAKALSANCVLIGEFVGGRMEGVRTLGAYLDGEPASFEYELAGSASAPVVFGKPCLCRSDAQTRFPADTLLPQVDAQALIALPLQDPQGRALGLIMALYRRPVASFRFAKGMLEIFSARAAAELNRKRGDDELRESEQRYRAFIAQNPDGMWRVELEQPVDTSLPGEEQIARIYQYGYVAECNDAAAHLNGLQKADQLIGCHLEDILPRSEPDAGEASLLGITGGHSFTVEITRRDGSGNLKYLLRSQWGIVEDGKLERIWGTTRDITELRHSEKELDASEQRMADLLETVQLVVVIVDPEGKVAFCNNYLYRKTGWRKPDVSGKDWLDLMVPAGDRSKLRQAFAAGAVQPDVPVHFESALAGPDGGRWQFEWDRTALRDTEGQIAGWANVGRDVTEYRALEAQFRQAQRLATIGRLAGGVAHDFNNLLTVILGYSAVLLENRDRTDPSYAALQEISKAAGKGAELTHRLLAFGCRQILHPQVLNLNAVIADAEHMLRRLIGDHIRLTTHLDQSAGSVCIDAGSFHQVLMNLAVNARDAMPRGGRLTIATSNATITEAEAKSGIEPGEYVQVTVSDTGTGMSEEVQGHLFEPFFTTKEQGKGTGLGLSTVYGIVRQSGGSIFVDTAPEKGTAFRIYFPRVVAEERQAQEANAAVVQQGTETILLVEDREDVRELTGRMLRDLGYTILEANGPARALEVAQDRSRTIHLLLTDVAMPEMTGFELADVIRTYQNGIKVLFMSGYTDASRVAEKLSEPGCAYLQKPFTPDALAASVREVLDHP